MSAVPAPRAFSRFRRRRRTPPGAPPGTLIPDPTEPPPVIRVMAYGPDGLVEATIADVAALRPLLAAWPVVWVNVDGLGDIGVIQALGELFGLHRLALEDVVNLHQRAKVDDYGDYLFIITHMVALNPALQIEQMSLFLGPNYVLTFQHLPGDSLEPVRVRLRAGNSHLRRGGAGYLTYALLDAVLDGYFPVLETLGERLEGLETLITTDPDPAVRTRIHELRQDLLALRRAVWPQRDALNTLLREPTSLLTPETRVYLRDTFDHSYQILDLVETYRELAADLTDLYLSSISNRMNEIMKVLTIISTIFIPLSFIAGVYGMNFDTRWPWNMPELLWPFGYLWALGWMAGVAGLMVFYFRRRHWL